MDCGLGSDDDDGDHELRAIGAAVGAALNRQIDPYAVAGLLAEDAAFAVSRYLPRVERDRAAAVLVVLLHDRLKAYGTGERQ